MTIQSAAQRLVNANTIKTTPLSTLQTVGKAVTGSGVTGLAAPASGGRGTSFGSTWGVAPPPAPAPYTGIITSTPNSTWDTLAGAVNTVQNNPKQQILNTPLSTLQTVGKAVTGPSAAERAAGMITPTNPITSPVHTALGGGVQQSPYQPIFADPNLTPGNVNPVGGWNLTPAGDIGAKGKPIHGPSGILQPTFGPQGPTIQPGNTTGLPYNGQPPAGLVGDLFPPGTVGPQLPTAYNPDYTGTLAPTAPPALPPGVSTRLGFQTGAGTGTPTYRTGGTR
jgi:hypothetical protein